MSQDKATLHDEIAGIGGRCFAYQARKTANAVLRAYNEWMKPVDLEMAQFSTLCAILDGRAESIGGLAELLGVERSTLVRNLKVLEKKGLIRVAARTSRRLTHELTEEGVAIMRRALPLWQQAQAAMEAAIGPPKERDVHGTLRDLRKALPVAFAPIENI
ncbi:MAG: MarR family winged helix-turn-helix transcriptional regulator [Bosea sp. (in: a-proteobacteria)]